MMIVDPKNPRRFYLWYSSQGAHGRGVNDHPQTVMRQWCGAHGATVYDCVPQSIADGWQFWIEFPEGAEIVAPEWSPIVISDGTPFLSYQKPWHDQPVGPR